MAVFRQCGWRGECFSLSSLCCICLWTLYLIHFSSSQASFAFILIYFKGSFFARTSNGFWREREKRQKQGNSCLVTRVNPVLWDMFTIKMHICCFVADLSITSSSYFSMHPMIIAKPKVAFIRGQECICSKSLNIFQSGPNYQLTNTATYHTTKCNSRW